MGDVTDDGDESPELPVSGKRTKKRAATLLEGTPIAQLMLEVEKQYGAGVIVRASKLKAIAVSRIQTTVFPFDLALGGGIPVGRISLFSGGKGCLSGDTLIDMPRDLRSYPKGIPLRELVGQRPYVYAWANGRIVLRQAVGVWSTGVRDVVRVRLATSSRNECRSRCLPPLELVGTSDHLVLLSDGVTWRQLGELRSGDRLCSLYRRISSPKHPESLLRWTGGVQVVREHRFICSALYGERDISVHAHHDDENSLNQSVGNLSWLDGSEHKSRHLKKRRAVEKTGWEISGIHPQGMKGKRHTSESRMRTAESMRNDWVRRRALGINHKVVSVQPAGIMEVFDMEVPDADSFVANGVIVHNSGKTTVSFKAVARFQDMTAHLDPPPHALWVDVEGVYNADWARVCGVDLDRLYVVRPSFAEQAIDVFCSMLSAKEIEFLVMDSIAALVPAIEIEKSAMDQQQGTQARLVGKMIRRVNGAMNDWAQRDAPRTVLFINQVRQKIGGFSPSGMTPEVEPGGLGQIFAASVTVRFKRIKYEFAQEADRTNGIGATTALNRFDVRNSKVSTPGQTGEFRLLLRDFAQYRQGNTDDLKLVSQRAQSLGYLRSDNGQWTIGVPGSRVIHAEPTKAKMHDAWLTDRSLYARVQADVIALTYQHGMHGASMDAEPPEGVSDERTDSGSEGEGEAE